MQTFLPLPDPVETAQVLDNKRLGKQRVEAIQIARTLLGLSKGWGNHPAVRMWRGYEAYLVLVYLPAMMGEWGEIRGFNNAKCAEHYRVLSGFVDLDAPPEPPPWITDEFCLAHQSNLIAKQPDHYRPLFPDTPDNLPYVWPA